MWFAEVGNGKMSSQVVQCYKHRICANQQMQPACQNKTIKLNRRACLARLLTLPILYSGMVSADEPAVQVPPEDDCSGNCSIWEVNCRSINCWDMPQELATSFLNCTHWQRRTEAELLHELCQDDVRTVIYVHGNRTSQADARQRVVRLASALRSRAPGSKLRVVAFSWPSEKPDGLLPKRLVEEKKSIIDAASIQLAGFLSRIKADQQVGIVGFSFGCAVTSAALHLQAGGAIAGFCLEETSECDCGKLRVGFIAPAFERDALAQCGRYSKALERVELLVNLYNSQDPILRRFRFFDPENPIAAGLMGLAVVPSNQPLVSSGNMVQFDCQNIGRTHAEADYYGCNRLQVLLDAVLGS